MGAFGESVARALRRAITGGGEHRVRLRTLILVRWIAVIGQAFTIVLVQVSLGIDLPLVPLLGAVLLSALVNLALSLKSAPTTRLTERSAALLLSYDILQLAFLLALTGGLKNPFAVLLLVPVTVCATILSLRTTIALCALVIAALTILVLWPTPLPWHGETFALPELYLAALWVALVLGCVMLAGYAWRVAEEARRMADALTATQMALAREQQLSALGGLAAAAAHELGTPLATIAVTARELQNHLGSESAYAEEVGLLVTQSRRCRDILRWLSQRPDTQEHDPFTRMPLSALVATVAEARRVDGIEMTVEVEPGDGGADEPVVPPAPALVHGLGNLIQNAFQFASRQIWLTVELGREEVAVRIEDDGPGFQPDIAERLGEPYVSSRHGTGLGLGVFIAQTLLARCGASIHFDSTDTGACVTVSWPRERLARVAVEDRP